MKDAEIKYLRETLSVIMEMACERGDTEKILQVICSTARNALVRLWPEGSSRLEEMASAAVRRHELRGES